MLHRQLLAVVGSALLAAPLAAESPDPYEPKVRGLTNPRYAEREKAARELEAAGEPALKALKAAQTSADEELRARAALVAEKIERAARSKKLLAAPKLALKFDNVPLDQAVNELSNKTGLRFTLDGAKVANVRRSITLDTGEVPFWEAVQAFYRAASLTEDDAPRDPTPSDQYTRSMRVRRLELSGTQTLTTRLIDGKLEPAATGAAFRVRALPAAFGQNKYDEQKGEVTVHLDVDSVPALTTIDIVGVEVRKAVTNDRMALAPAYPAREMSSLFGDFAFAGAGQQLVIVNGDLVIDGWNGSGGSQFPVTLKTHGSRPKQLAELHGVVVARVMTPPEPILTVSDVFGKAKGQTFRAEGLTCQVTAVNPKAGELQTPGRMSVAPRPVATTPAPARAAGTPVDMAGFSVRLVSTGEATNEIVNLPIQIKGKLQPFIRLNRRMGATQQHMPEFQVRDADGNLLRVLASRQTESSFDGVTLTQEIQLTIDKPAKGLDGVSFTLTSRRPATVEMPFVLKDVPLP
jgi:hypothetical protein